VLVLHRAVPQPWFLGLLSVIANTVHAGCRYAAAKLLGRFASLRFSIARRAVTGLQRFSCADVAKREP
jgi:hypothetical protein